MSTFAVDVDRGAATLGLGLKYMKQKILVQQVQPGGAMDAHNIANPDKSIRKDDLIVSVNDVELDPDKMVKEIKAKTKLWFVVERSLT